MDYNFIKNKITLLIDKNINKEYLYAFILGNIKYIKEKAFDNQYYLEIQAFPLGIEEIGEYAFRDCYDLNTSMVHGVTIKRYAFSGAFGK